MAKKYLVIWRESKSSALIGGRRKRRILKQLFDKKRDAEDWKRILEERHGESLKVRIHVISRKEVEKLMRLRGD